MAGDTLKKETEMIPKYTCFQFPMQAERGNSILL
jgi:hypothetical protein